MLRSLVVRIWLGCLLGLPALGASGLMFTADAMPPYPGQPGESPTPAFAAAVDLYNQMRASFAERGIDQPGGGLAAGAQVSGPFKVLAICVDFPDKVASVPAIRFDTLIFGSGPGSVSDFYYQMSYHTLIITTVNLPSTLGWQRLSNNYSYYVNGNYGLGSSPHNSQKLCEDLVDLVDPLVNFADYDNDGNGYVDGLVIVHPGRGAEFSGSTNDIWSHTWGIYPRLKDGVYISAYTIQPEYWNSPGDITIGVYAHETGHLFGLPDLYDVDNSSRGVGRWSLMSTGAWNGNLGNSPAYMDAWCRSRLGFATPTNVTSNVSAVTIPAIETTPTIFRLWADGTMGNEYFLLENRQRTGYDAQLPGAGLLIWHIDESQGSNSAEWYPGHTSSGNYLVALEQSDGLFQLEKNTSYGDNGDPFPGSGNKTTFSAATTPNSNAYSGSPTYVTITNISPSGPTMTCDFVVSIIADVSNNDDWQSGEHATNLTNSPNPFNPSTTLRFSSDSQGPVTLAVYDILGRHVRTLFSGNADPGVHQLTWNGDDASGRPLASGVYFGRLASARGVKVHKMVLLH